MANTIILKRSATPAKVPTTGQLALGEIAINTYDGLIYIKKDNGTASVVQIGGVTSVNGETGSVTITTDDVSDAGQTNKFASAAVVRGHVSAGTGISYNSSTGVISTSQSITTSASPQFAGLTLTGNMGITGHIVPSADNTYDLGSASYMWRDVYVGPGSLYVNGQKVLEDNSGTITVSADVNQSLQLITSGTGNVQLSTGNSGVIQISSTLQIASGKNITDSAGAEVNFGDPIDMNSNKIIGLGAPSANTDAATKLYVDTEIGNISTSSIAQGNSNVTVTDSGTGTVTVTVDGSTALTVNASGVTVAGNLIVSGATTTVESNTISLADNIITLNSDATGVASQNAGIEVERGDDTNVQIRWNEGSDVWQFTNDGATYNPLAVNTDGLAEGSTNQYFTNTRARGAVSGSSGTGISYNSGTGTFSLGSIPNSSLTNTAVTIGSTSTALGATSTTLAGLTSVTSTTFVGALTGNASTATTLATPRTIAMSGDVNWTSLAFDGSGSVSSASTISALAVTNAMLAGSIANAKLTNSTVTIGSTSTALGATSTTLAGLTSVTSTTFVGALTGNASTATILETPRAIQGVNFDGSAAITVVTAGTGISVAGTAVTSTLSASGGSIGGAITTPNATSSMIPFYYANTSSFPVATSSHGALAHAHDTGKMYFAHGGSWNMLANNSEIPTNTNQLTNGAGYVTSSGVTSIAAGSYLTGGTVTSTGTFAVDATSANTGSKVVARDGSGNFSAGTITATLSGTATGLAGTPNITVGTITSGAIAATGSITATGEITAYFSDERLKMDINPIQGALNKVMAIGGYTYKANELAHTLGVSRYDNQIGLLAGEVEAVMPELVTESGLAGYKTIRYDKVVSVLVEAIKEQQAMIEELRQEVKSSRTLH